jgi:hypothetical protein
MSLNDEFLKDVAYLTVTSQSLPRWNEKIYENSKYGLRSTHRDSNSGLPEQDDIPVTGRGSL